MKSKRPAKKKVSQKRKRGRAQDISALLVTAFAVAAVAFAGFTKDPAGKAPVCALSGTAASRDLLRTTILTDNMIAGDYIKAEKLFRGLLAKYDATVPDYINAVMLARYAEMESNNGLRMVEKGNPHIGFFAIDPNGTEDNSVIAERMEQILAVLNAVKEDIPSLAGCGPITKDIFNDSKAFNDPLVAGLAVLTVAYHADRKFKLNHPNYLKLDSDHRQAALYVDYNIQVAANAAVDNYEVAPTGRLQPLLNYVSEKHRRVVQGFMEMNRRVYGPADTPNNVLDKVLANTKERATFVQNYIERPVLMAEESKAIGRFIKGNFPESEAKPERTIQKIPGKKLYFITENIPRPTSG